MKQTILLVVLSLGSYFTTLSQNSFLQTGDQVNGFQCLFDKTNNPGVSCYRIPALITAPNGDLIAAVDERVPSCGDLRSNTDINIVIRRSIDNGKSWSAIETIVDYPAGQSASDPSMIVDRVTGDVFLFFNFMDIENGKDIYALKLIKSSDNGKSWRKPTDITDQIAKAEWLKDFKFITSGNGIQTSEGRLLNTLLNIDKGLFVFGSDDHGKSWYLIDTPINPADESRIVELADGNWMINSRVNGSGFRYKHISTDEGKTWLSKPDSALVDPGCNAGLIRYSSSKDGSEKNRLLFSNVNTKNERRNLTVRVSYDEGKSWSTGKVIYSGSSAYSALCVLQNGDIGLLFEKDDYHEIAFISFTRKWLTDGQD